VFISVRNASGKMIGNADAYDNSKCEEVKNHLTNTMETLFPNWKGIYTKDDYTITNRSNKVGTIEIGYYGPFYYNDNDIMYSKTLNKILISVGIASLCIALIVGLLMAEGLSRPILNVIDIAEMISKGNYGQRIEKKTYIEEIDKLTKSINNLGSYLMNMKN